MDIDSVNFGKRNIPILLNSNTVNSVRRNYIINIVVSFLIYFLTFSFFHLLKKQTFYFNKESLILLGIYIASLIIGAVLSRKFKFKSHDAAYHTFKNLYLSIVISLASFIISVVILRIDFLMRSYVLGAFFSGLVIESLYFTILSKYNKVQDISIITNKKLSVKYLIVDGIILTIFCYLTIISNLFPVNFKEKEFLLLSVTFIIWLISAATTHKFIPSVIANNRWNALELQSKFYLQIIAVVILSMLFLQIDTPSSIYFIRMLIGYVIVSSLVSMFLFGDKIKNKSDEATVVFLKAYEMSDPVIRTNHKNGNGKYCFNNIKVGESEAKRKLQFEFFKEYGDLFTMLETMIDLKSFDTRKTIITKSYEQNNLELSRPDSHQLFINLHVLNDQIKLNDYILNIRNSLVPGGVFVGAILPHHYRYKRYLKKHSYWLGSILYFMDFFWKRVFPKIPFTREIYSSFSKEQDRALSLAEGLGRLVYCGFKIIDLAVVDDVVYFAAAKNGLYLPTKKFFYSPVFKMKRIGKGGKNIYVYKFRTMYPYSEFIQDFVYEHNNLELGGKFKDDFRVPAWGRLFRKLWIDELPMLINLIKGDLKLVGVRPISEHYLSLYSKGHQKRRINFKPGLIPPFYADLPKTLEEIELSEKRYLDAYEKNPLKSDITYLFKSLNNIFLKHKRSA